MTATASYTRGQEVNNAKELLGRLQLMEAQAEAAGASAKQLTDLRAQIAAQIELIKQQTETEKGRTKTESSRGDVYQFGTRALGPLKDVGAWTGTKSALACRCLTHGLLSLRLRLKRRVVNGAKTKGD